MNIQLQPLSTDDLSFCATLVGQAGWNQVDEDWKRLMELDPEGCFLVKMDGHRVGAIASTRFLADARCIGPTVAWISMVLVHEKFRGLGIGREMFARVLEKLKTDNINTIRLDATRMGFHIYSKFGFEEEYQLVRMVRTPSVAATRGFPDNTLATNVNDQIDAALLAHLDCQITATNRIPLIQSLIRTGHVIQTNAVPDSDGAFPTPVVGGPASGTENTESGGSGIGAPVPRDDNISAYLAFRPGRTGWQIGPCIARDEKSGLSLLQTTLRYLAHEKIIIDIPLENATVIQWARENKFVEQRRFIRMFHGHKIDDSPSHIMASFGPEKG